MNKQKKMNNGHNIKARTSPNDKIYTPRKLAKDIIDSVAWEDNEFVIDPCRGKGAFYDQLPHNVIKEWFEIDEGIDFLKSGWCAPHQLNFTNYDLKNNRFTIIQNPPYSCLNEWFDKCIELKPDRMCFLLLMYALTDTRIQKFEKAGYSIFKLDVCKVHSWYGHQVVVWWGKTSIYGKSIIGQLGRYKKDEGEVGTGRKLARKEDINFELGETIILECGKKLDEDITNEEKRKLK